MSEPIAGKYLLEILTKGMYSNPMHVYREYIQNASDSMKAYNMQQAWCFRQTRKLRSQLPMTVPSRP